MKYLVTAPWWLRMFYTRFTWRVPATEKVVYLTFDDGPTPEITEWVLDQLEKHRAGATFFLIGNNIEKHPAIFEQLKQSGHTLGNHTYRHLNGWKTPDNTYLSDFRECDALLDTRFFRPPYGRIRKSAAREILTTHKIVMWDIITGDWDPNVSARACAARVAKNMKPGSIIVFHDSIKAWPRLKEALPLVLDLIDKRGYRSEPLH